MWSEIHPQLMKKRGMIIFTVPVPGKSQKGHLSVNHRKHSYLVSRQIKDRER
jgi:hypothetical protein